MRLERGSSLSGPHSGPMVDAMNPNTPPPARARLSIGYQNAVLTAIALLAGLGLVERGGSAPAAGPSAAMAQEQPESGGLSNALEQRKQIIAELRVMNGRLERIDARLAGKLEVKVVDMPPLKLPPEAKPRPDRADRPDRPEPKPEGK
jgi:hypothetical protein